MEWGSIADWVSGIGSMSASIVALYLAKAANRIKLQAHFGVRVLIGPNTPEQDVVVFGVTNVGNRSTVVKSLGLRTGLFKKRYGYIAVEKNNISDVFPKALADGEEGNWSIYLHGQNNWLNELRDKFVSDRLDAWTLYLQIHTSNGGVINVRAEKGLRRKLMEIPVRNK
jgi:hypothetical protein